MNTVIKKKIGENIRRLRMRQDMTQEVLSARMQVEGCDVTRSALAKIEVGQRHLYPDELIVLQEIFAVPYEEILKIE